MVQRGPASPRRGRISRYLAPAALLGVLAAILVVLASAPRSVGPHGRTAGTSHRSARRIAPYWTVHPGDTTRKSPPRPGWLSRSFKRSIPTPIQAASNPGSA
jgi:hypothetical protein